MATSEPGLIRLSHGDTVRLRAGSLFGWPVVPDLLDTVQAALAEMAIAEVQNSRLGAYAYREGGQIVGLCGAQTPEDRDGSVEIGQTIAPDQRGRGQGGTALWLLIREAQGCGLNALTTTVDGGDADAERHLTRAGFRPMLSASGPRRWRRPLAVALRGLNHVTFTVSDLPRSITFYRDILRGRLRAVWDGGAYLEIGDLWLALLVGEPAPATDGSHVALTVVPEDFPVIAARIRGVTGEWKTNRSEGESLYFLDPDGHRLELHDGTLSSRLNAYAAAENSGVTIDPV